MLKKLFKVLLITLFFPYQVYSTFTIATFRNSFVGENVGSVKLSLDYFAAPKIVNKHLYVAVVTGKQGIMKSTLLKALGRYFNLNRANFTSGDSNLACTTEISFADSTPSGIVLADQPGKDDGALSLKLGIDSKNLDIMFTRLMSPITNVLIYVRKNNYSIHVVFNFIY